MDIILNLLVPTCEKLKESEEKQRKGKGSKGNESEMKVTKFRFFIIQEGFPGVSCAGLTKVSQRGAHLTVSRNLSQAAVPSSRPVAEEKKTKKKKSWVASLHTGWLAEQLKPVGWLAKIPEERDVTFEMPYSGLADASTMALAMQGRCWAWFAFASWFCVICARPAGRRVGPTVDPTYANVFVFQGHLFTQLQIAPADEHVVLSRGVLFARVGGLG